MSLKTHSFTDLAECPAVAFRARRLAASLWISCGKDTQFLANLKFGGASVTGMWADVRAKSTASDSLVVAGNFRVDGSCHRGRSSFH